MQRTRRDVVVNAKIALGFLFFVIMGVRTRVTAFKLVRARMSASDRLYSKRKAPNVYNAKACNYLI